MIEIVRFPWGAGLVLHIFLGCFLWYAVGFRLPSLQGAGWPRAARWFGVMFLPTWLGALGLTVLAAVIWGWLALLVPVAWFLIFLYWLRRIAGELAGWGA